YFFVRAVNVPGQHLPAYAVSTGKVLLAYQWEVQLRETLSKVSLTRYTDRTITDTRQLLEELRKVRAHGYAVSDGELEEDIDAVKGAGDLDTGDIHRLERAGFTVIAAELPHRTVLRRTIAFAEAIALEHMTVEGITAQHAHSIEDTRVILENGFVPILIDPDGIVFKHMHPDVLVEATLSKYNSGINMKDAPIVIALGPGYEAGVDVHAVVETNRGHNLGRVYLEGKAEPNTGVPGTIG